MPFTAIQSALLSLLLAFSAGSVFADRLPSQWEIGGKVLPKAGESTYKILWLRITTAALYTPRGASAKNGDILDPAYEKLLTIEYGVDVTREKFEEMARDALKDHWPAETLAQHQASIDAFCRWLVDVEKNDRYTLHWLPERGLELALNGVPAGVIEQAEGAALILSIWLGQAAISTDQRDDILKQWHVGYAVAQAEQTPISVASDSSP